MKPRVFLAGLFHETNTFAEGATALADFQISKDQELFLARGNGSPMDGFLASAQEFGWEIVPGVDFRAQPSGMPVDAVFETFWQELKSRLTLALERGVDAIFLVLHGAMVTPSHPDVEGELLERIRSQPGAEELPLVAVLDLHANVSEKMARHASALVPYRENPHTDARETAVRAASLLGRAFEAGVSLRTNFQHARVLLAPPSTGTTASPLWHLEKAARALESSAGYWEVGIAAGFAHADTPEAGVSVWIVSADPEICCQRDLNSLCILAQELSAEAQPGEWDLAEALDRISHEQKFPALLVEPADNIGGGAPGDSKFILRALLARPLGCCGVILNAPKAVTALEGTPIGATATLTLGREDSAFDPEPLTIEVTLQRLSDGTFELEDRQSHLASMAGMRIEMGPCAVVTCRHVTILLTSRPTPPFDLGQWRSQGIDPKMFDIISVKAAVGHRRAYDRIAASSYTVRTPGPCTSEIGLLPYKRLRRPIFPLDA